MDDFSETVVPNQPAKLRTRPATIATGEPPAPVPEAVTAPVPEPVRHVEQAVAASAPEAVAAASAYSEKALASMRDWTAFNIETVAAFARASDILVLGTHDLLQLVRQSGQAAFDEGLTGIRAIASAETVKERMELQANLFRTSLDHGLSDGKRLMLASLDLAEKASAPLTARAALAAEKLGSQPA